jgi:cleavage and polyadenylation specificity factor subunit 5
MLQIANAFFKLPGDYLLPHEQEIPGFQARLSERLSPQRSVPPATVATPSNGTAQNPTTGGITGGGLAGSSSYVDHLIPEGDDGEWHVADCVAQWWRPNFETFMYPFIPAHVTRPKECKKMYLIQLPKKSISLPPFPRSPPLPRLNRSEVLKNDTVVAWSLFL